jgi:hypothetical protein
MLNHHKPFLTNASGMGMEDSPAINCLIGKMIPHCNVNFDFEI